MTAGLQEQQGTKETRVQQVFLDFQVWMAYLGTPGLRDPEGNPAWTATTAHEGTLASQDKEEPLAQGAPRAFLGRGEKKEIQCSFQAPSKVFRGTEAIQDPWASRDLEVQEDPWAQWATQGSQGPPGSQVTPAALA